MSSASFRFNTAVFDFGDGMPIEVRLVADRKLIKHDTHFTLLMGANGTCKSRLLSCCVNLLKSIDEQGRTPSAKKSPRLQKHSEPDSELRCSSAQLIRDGVLNDIEGDHSNGSGTSLPSRVLAVANLVRDRFTFVDWNESDDPFYYYLGVRQASNLTTTGAMDRLVCDAVVQILKDKKIYSSFSTWLSEVLPLSAKGLAFSNYSRSRIEKFVENPVKTIKRHSGSGRLLKSDGLERAVHEVEMHSRGILALADLIQARGHKADDSGSPGMQRPRTLTLILDELSADERGGLGELSRAIQLTARFHLLSRPALVVRSRKWLDFTQLSSGEQNLLATGARLLAFAKPGAFIVIDEPEVSLNVAWQQRYIDLISHALAFAKGSHVVIASHSPYLVSDLRSDNSTIVVIERNEGRLKFRSHEGEFWGWGSEAILYEVLGLPSASNFLFSRELAAVLALVRRESRDIEAIRKFLRKCDDLDFGGGAESLSAVIDEIRRYAKAVEE